MALSTQQIANLNALNQKISGGYNPNDIDRQNLAYAQKQGYNYTPLAQGATKITDPNYLKTAGLTESQIYRSGTDIYKLPTIPTQVSGDQLTGGVPNVPVVEQAPIDTTPFVAGLDTGQKGFESLIKTIMTPTATEAKVTPITQKITELTGGFEQKPADYQAQLDQYGFKTNVQDLQKLNSQIAATKAEYDKYAVAQEGRVASAGSIYGRQALAQRQAAIELGGLSSMAQALQGNVQMAMDIADKTIAIKYEPLEKQIEDQKFQLEQVYDQLGREEKRKADALNLALDERARKIDEEKETEKGINEIMLAAAQGGATSTDLQKIMKAKTLGDAIVSAKNFLNISTDSSIPQKIGTDSEGNDLYFDPVTGSVKTAGQLTSNQLGVQVGTIKGLPSYDTRTANPGMNRSDRNNNPGNIKVSDYTKDFDGVVGVESNPASDGGNFLIFENPEAGLNAIGRLLLEGKSYQGVNAETAIKRYNGNGAYSAKDVGLDPNGDFQSQIQDPVKRLEVARKIAMAEGWSGGLASEIETNKSAQNWADLINKGEAKITDVPADERTEVTNALALTPKPQDQELDIIAKEKAQIASTLKSHSGLNNAVGTIALGRKAPFQWGQKADFIASVEQLVSDLSLESLIDAKSRGATFGALSDSEMRILASAATKIGTWRQRDKDGNVIGYKASESAFRNELDNISKIFLRAVKGNELNQSTNTTQTPIMIGQTPGGMGYQVIE